MFLPLDHSYTQISLKQKHKSIINRFKNAEMACWRLEANKTSFTYLKVENIHILLGKDALLILQTLCFAIARNEKIIGQLRVHHRAKLINVTSS